MEKITFEFEQVNNFAEQKLVKIKIPTCIQWGIIVGNVSEWVCEILNKGLHGIYC